MARGAGVRRRYLALFGDAPGIWRVARGSGTGYESRGSWLRGGIMRVTLCFGELRLQSLRSLLTDRLADDVGGPGSRLVLRAGSTDAVISIVLDPGTGEVLAVHEGLPTATAKDSASAAAEPEPAREAPRVADALMRTVVPALTRVTCDGGAVAAPREYYLSTLPSQSGTPEERERARARLRDATATAMNETDLFMCPRTSQFLALALLDDGVQASLAGLQPAAGIAASKAAVVYLSPRLEPSAGTVSMFGCAGAASGAQRRARALRRGAALGHTSNLGAEAHFLPLEYSPFPVKWGTQPLFLLYA